MIRNSLRMLLLGLFLVTHSDVLAVAHQKNEVVEKVDKGQSKNLADKSESNVKNKTIQKSASKSRQRMSAGKIAIFIILVPLGAAAVGALIGLVWFGIASLIFH